MGRIPMSPRVLARRVGRRGQALFYSGLISVFLGIGYATSPPFRRPGIFVLHDLVPIPWWGLAWIVLGTAGAAFAFTQKPGRDHIGFNLVILMPSLQAASYTVSWGIDVFTDKAGDPRGIFTALAFIAFARLIGIAAAWPEPGRWLPRLADGKEVR